MGSIGPLQIILVLVLVLILFGAGKLPRVMGDVAKGIKNFKSGMKDDSEDTDTATTSKQIDGEAETVTATQSSKDEAAKT